jgi:hypothetical protein
MTTAIDELAAILTIGPIACMRVMTAGSILSRLELLSAFRVGIAAALVRMAAQRVPSYDPAQGSETCMRKRTVGKHHA